jgi:hypothetical protein
MIHKAIFHSQLGEDQSCLCLSILATADDAFPDEDSSNTDSVSSSHSASNRIIDSSAPKTDHRNMSRTENDLLGDGFLPIAKNFDLSGKGSIRAGDPMDMIWHSFNAIHGDFDQQR